MAEWQKVAEAARPGWRELNVHLFEIWGGGGAARAARALFPIELAGRAS